MTSRDLWRRKTSILILLIGSAFSILWAVSLQRSAPGRIMGFPGIYFGTQCLLHGCDPYNVSQLERFYEERGLSLANVTQARRQSIALYVNLPATFLFVAPFALLPLTIAQALWTSLLALLFQLAAYLIWTQANRDAPKIALLLVFIFVANCQIIFSGGNTAGFVVAIGIIAVWCFLHDRFIPAAVIGLAISLCMKPHDIGLLWLFFVLRPGINRKRAIYAGVIAAACIAVSTAWVTVAAPHWLTEYRINLATISAHGGINDPGPSSIGATSPDMIVDLQTILSLVHDAPRFYNTTTYAICSFLLLCWILAVRRMPDSPLAIYSALSVAVALSMLVTYHRSYDAKLLLLAVPACAMLWTETGVVSWSALGITAAAATLTSDIPLTTIVALTQHLNLPGLAAGPRLLYGLLSRPAPATLLAVAIFYLWVLRRAERFQFSALSQPLKINEASSSAP